MGMTTAPAPTPDWRGPAMAGYLLILLVFGLMGGWAAFAKLDRAVVAPAVIAVESNRKVVQHFEGGIVSEIFVREGDQVSDGQVLFRLNDVQARAGAELQRNQLDAALVLQARLLAERDQATAIDWPIDLLRRRDEPLITRLIQDQTAQFTSRQVARQGQTDILGQRAEQLRQEIRGFEVERRATEQQLVLIQRELAALQDLLRNRLVPVSRVMALEREQARLEGLVGRLLSDAAKAEQAISETQLQAAQLQQRFHEDTAAALIETRQKIDDLRERIAVASDVLSRIEIRAPRAGTVLGLRVFSLGQVIRSGEALLEIVPFDDQLVVHAQFAPPDIANLHPGQEVEVRFPSFQSRTIPLVIGRLDRLSQDRLTDAATGHPYFLGTISVDKLALPPSLEARLRAGMPAEIFVATGERTALSYLTSPLTASLRRAFTEE
jgi:HlyD family secretion protein